MRKIETIAKGDDDPVGNRVRVKVVKNKVAPPFRRAELEMEFGKGISAEGSLLDVGVKYDIIEKSGSWYSYNGNRMGQGRDNVKEYLKSNSDIAAEIEEKVRKILFSSEPVPVSDESSETAEPISAKPSGITVKKGGLEE